MLKILLLGLGIGGSVCGQGLSWEDRLRWYNHRTYSWQRLTLLAGETSLDHLLGEPGEWGREPHNYAVRYSSAFGRRLVRNSLELALGAAFNEDTRFHPSQRSGIRPRLRYAFRQAFATPDRRFAWSRFGATLGGTVITSRWDPRPSSPGRLLEQFANGYLGHLENSLLAEFEPDLKRFGRKLRMRVFGR